MAFHHGTPCIRSSGPLTISSVTICTFDLIYLIVKFIKRQHIKSYCLENIQHRRRKPVTKSSISLLMKFGKQKKKINFKSNFRFLYTLLPHPLKFSAKMMTILTQARFRHCITLLHMCIIKIFDGWTICRTNVVTLTIIKAFPLKGLEHLTQ